MVMRPNLFPEIELSAIEQSVWVIFTNNTDIKILKILRKGFRHCFVVMQQDGRWIVIDPRLDKTEIQILPHPKDFNLPRYFIEQGNNVLKMPQIKVKKKLNSLFSVACVGAVKRILGIRKPLIITPYALYRYINKLKYKAGE